MRKIRNLLVALIFLLPIPQYATTTVNLTPVPKEMTVQEGQLLLPEEIKINSGSLSAEIGRDVTLGNDTDALIVVSEGATHTQNPEGYYLQVTNQQVIVEASTGISPTTRTDTA